MEAINLKEKFSLFSEHWSPKVVGEVNDFHVKLAKVKGEFTWHHHEREDEMFLVVEGRLLVRMRDRDIWLDEGEFTIVLRGVEHTVIAPEETHIMLFEPKGTLNTGNVTEARTVAEPERI